MDFDLWDFAEMEAIVPGIITGVVDIVCENCGGTSQHDPQDNSTIYHCPFCGEQNEI